MIRHATSIPLCLRLAGLVIGASIFIWVPFEDLSIQWVLLLSVAICSWFATRLLLNHSTRNWLTVVRHSLVGGLAGLAVAPVAFLLIILKNGLHLFLPAGRVSSVSGYGRPGDAQPRAQER